MYFASENAFESDYNDTFFRNIAVLSEIFCFRRIYKWYVIKLRFKSFKYKIFTQQIWNLSQNFVHYIK